MANGQRRLVVLTGPIGAGKSTVAGLLAHRFMSAGRSTAVTDLDDVAFAQHGTSDVLEFWRRAGVAHAALVRGWFDAGCEVVMAHGPFFESGGYESLFEASPPDVTVTHVVLRVAVEEALRRVTSDGDRGADARSRNPVFLRSAHDAFARQASQLPSVDLQLDTSALTAQEAADWLAESL